MTDSENIYGRVEEGKLILSSDSQNGKLIMLNIPEHDKNKQYIERSNYEESEEVVIVNYDIFNKELTYEDNLEFQRLKALSFMFNNLPDEQALEVPLVFSKWEEGMSYSLGNKLIYNDVLYKVLQSHTSQATWTPDTAPSLFAKLLNETVDGSVPEWVQPDSTNAYNTGDRVIFEGKTYESMIDGNVWSPTAYPAGWNEVI